MFYNVCVEAKVDVDTKGNNYMTQNHYYKDEKNAKEFFHKLVNHYNEQRVKHGDKPIESSSIEYFDNENDVFIFIEMCFFKD